MNQSQNDTAIPPQKKETKLFNNKYILKKKLSSGTFGVVFIAQEKDTNKFFAIKLEKDQSDELSSIEREIEVLQRLKDIQQVPQIHWYGNEFRYNVIVIDLLGRDLAYYLKINKKMNLRTVIRMTTQLIKVLEDVHNRKIVHRDMKPENIVIGREEQKNQVYLIDFGISKFYKDSNGRHISFKENKPFIGTARYASIAAHKGVELSRKDDLESLGYVIIFQKGHCPGRTLKMQMTMIEQKLSVR